MNTATIIGRAGQDAEIKYFESGKVKTTFSLAVGRWDSIVDEVEMGEGDIVRTFKRVIDVLRQFCTISGIPEALAFTAREAINLINRSPIDIDG